MPALLKLADEAAYLQHFMRNFVRAKITTHDGMRVYFSAESFAHAFYESSNRRGAKDVFSLTRAERMDWIAAGLSDPAATMLQGWDMKHGKYHPARRVTVVVKDFVVVLSIGKRKDETLRANFLTCFQADNSIDKILQSPPWTLEAFNNAE